MSTTAGSPAMRTYTPDDLLRMPDGKGFELVDGKLVERHGSIESSRIGARLLHRLGNEAARFGGVVVFASDLGYRCFPHDHSKIRRASMSLVRKDRLAALQGDPAFAPIPADLAVEVVSPKDLYYEVQQKVEDYLAAGFGMVWVVHPILKTVTVYRQGAGVTVLHQDDTITAEPVLPEFRCVVREFFTA